MAKNGTPETATNPKHAGERSGLRRDVLSNELLGKAASLFAARGVAATSLQDIANEVGLSRTSMYYYFPSKEALLDALIRGVTQRTTSIFAEVASGPKSHAERLGETARQLVMWVTDPDTHFKLIDRSERELPEDLARVHRDTKRRVLSRMTKLIEDGTRSGEFKAVNPRVAAFAILGMCNWTAWWFSPDGDLERKEVAEQIAALAVASVGRSKGPREANDLRGLLQAIRENLDAIEQSGQKQPKPRR